MPAVCSPNYHGRWQAKHRAVHGTRSKPGGVRQDWHLIALVAMGARRKGFPLQKVRIDAVFDCGGALKGDGLYRPKDIENAIASLKPAIDGIVDSRMITNDTKRYVEIGTVTVNSTKKQHQGRKGLTLIVTEI